MMDFTTFRKTFSLRLDAQQERAVRHTEGPVLLLAVPGSGKTTTIYGSKGLEYDRVNLMDVLDGVLPQSAASSGRDEDKPLEEERRLFYVGLTRAKHQLEVLCCRNLSSSFASQLFPEEALREIRPAPKPSAKRIPQTDPEGFTVGVLVQHKQFGQGLICSRSGNIVLIRFESGEQKRIALHTALRSGVLRLEI